mgnify:FL=1
MEMELYEESNDNDYIIFLGAGAISNKARNLEKAMLELVK